MNHHRNKKNKMKRIYKLSNQFLHFIDMLVGIAQLPSRFLASCITHRSNLHLGYRGVHCS